MTTKDITLINLLYPFTESIFSSCSYLQRQHQTHAVNECLTACGDMITVLVSLISLSLSYLQSCIEVSYVSSQSLTPSLGVHFFQSHLYTICCKWLEMRVHSKHYLPCSSWSLFLHKLRSFLVCPFVFQQKLQHYLKPTISVELLFELIHFSKCNIAICNIAFWILSTHNGQQWSWLEIAV